MADSPAEPNQKDLFAALAAHGITVRSPGSTASDHDHHLMFNGAVRSQPWGVVRCLDEASVRLVTRVAAEAGGHLAVLAGGHDLWGRAFEAGNLILDIRDMNHVSVDLDAREVTVGGGTLTRDLLAGLPDDWVTATGTVLSVGVPGLTMGGGYGRLTPRLGLGADCLKRARVVLADGSVCNASEQEDADLLWALRGGGSGFGVVTEMTLALHHVPQVLGALILFPLAEAARLLLQAQDLIDRHPDDLSLFMGFMTAPDGSAMLFMAPLWCGEAALGGSIIDDLSARTGAVVLDRRWCPYKATFSEESEKAWPKGRNYHLLTQSFQRLDAPIAEILVDGARTMTSPNSAIVLHDFHGAPTRVARNATAFPLREPHFVVELIAAWDHPASDGAAASCRHRTWADALSRQLAPLSLAGGYVSLLAPEEVERVGLFYRECQPRLAAIKHRVDDRDVFRSAFGKLP